MFCQPEAATADKVGGPAGTATAKDATRPVSSADPYAWAVCLLTGVKFGSVVNPRPGNPIS